MPPSLLRPALVAGVVLSAALPMAAQQTAKPHSKQRNVITAEEIEALQGVEDAYQVVLRLRPEFLRVRARSQFRTPVPDPLDEDGGRRAGPVSSAPTLSVTRAPAGGAGRAPDPDAPEFTSGRTSGGTAGQSQQPSSRSGTAVGGGSLTGGAPEARVGMMGPSYTDESGIAVYVGNVKYGGVEELTRLLAADITEIRYLSPSEAQFRFGPRHDAGVIIVTLK
jgi:hypothetical protein